MFRGGRNAGGRGGGGGFTPGATQRIPFGDAGGAALTDDAGLTYSSANRRIIGAGGGAAVQLEDTNGASIGYMASGAGVNCRLSNGRLFTGGMPTGLGSPVAITATWDAAKFEVTTGLNLFVGSGDIADAATNGDFRFPTTAGVPTGVPSGGKGSARFAKSTNKLYLYDGSAWVAQT